MTQWPANREGKAVLLCLEHWCGWTGNRDNTVESYQPLKRRTPQCPGLDPKVTSEVTAVRKSCLMTDDEGYWRRGVTYQKKAEQNLFGWGFVHISGEYVEGCWHSWTHHLPWLDMKLRNLASTRRTSLEFWCQDVEHLILCKLQFWLWRGRKTKSSLLATKVTFEKLRISKQTCNLQLVGRAASVSGLAYNQAAGQLVETQYAMIAHVFVVSETYVHCWRPMLSGDTVVTWREEHYGMKTAIELFFLKNLNSVFLTLNVQIANVLYWLGLGKVHAPYNSISSWSLILYKGRCCLSLLYIYI